MKKRIIGIALVVAMLAIVITGGTLAYLTDKDGAKNVMTVGDVKIEQHEYQRAVDANGDYILGTEGTDFTANYGISQSYKLEQFQQDQRLYPAVYTNDERKIAYDDFQQLWNGVGAPGSNEIFDDSVKNVIDKFVFVENTGDYDIYFRTIVAIEWPEGLDYETLLHDNFNSNNRYDLNDDMAGVQNVEDGKPDQIKRDFIEIGNTRYLVITATHTEILAAKETARPSLLQVFLDPSITNEQFAKFGATWDILTLSQAVQSTGFETLGAVEALDTAFGNVTNASLVEWLTPVAAAQKGPVALG